MGRLRGACDLFAVAVAELTAIWTLHRMGSQEWLQLPWSSLSSWLVTTSPEAALASGIRLAALACAYWLLATTVLYTLARVAGLTRAVRALEWATLPVVRRAADKLVAIALASALSNSSAVALAAVKIPDPSPSDAVVDIYIPIPAGDSDEVADTTESAPSTPATPSPQAPSETASASVSPSPSQRADRDGHEEGHPRRAVARTRSSDKLEATHPQTGRQAIRRHTVTPGDNLWDIAATYLSQSLGQPVASLSSAEIASYWVDVIAENRASLSSGDPDLIYPGEVIYCPPVAEVNE